MQKSGPGVHRLKRSPGTPTRHLLRILVGAIAVAPLLVVATVTSASAASAAVIGPDVSSHNHDKGGTVNWVTAHGAGGASFAFVKATEGGTYRNPNFASDFASIRAAGMIRGAYHYARPSGTTKAALIADATAEASFFVHIAGTLSAKGDLPPVLDIETAGTLNPAQLSLWTHTWLDRTQRLTGRTPMVYTYAYFWRQKMGNSAGFARYPLWLASYSSTKPAMVGGWKSYTFWQYTPKARLAGANRTLDMSVFSGSATQLRAMAHYAPAPALPQITAVLSSSNVRSATVTHLSGATSRSLAGRTVFRQGYYSGGWHTWATTKVSAAGTYSFAIRATVPVNYYRTIVQLTNGSWIASRTLALHTYK
ncbi:MAG TPA: GH25 family lysozyme [Dermatophilaceae bacterium]